MTVLVLAPHPDDETIGCGGLLRLAADEGKRTVVVFLTSGEQGVPGRPPADARRLREAEAEAATGILGVARSVFLRGADWAVGDDIESVAKRLRPVLEDEAPEAIHLPHEGDAHPDHAATRPLLSRALPPGLSAALLAYEVWTPMAWYDEVVDVGGAMTAKMAALGCYASQLEQLRYDAAAEGLARYRGALAGGCTYAEVFQHLSPAADPLAAAAPRAGTP